MNRFSHFAVAVVGAAISVLTYAESHQAALAGAVVFLTGVLAHLNDKRDDA